LQRRTETAPLRQRALQMGAQGLQGSREDLSSIFADAGNPYARVAPRPVAPPMGPPQPVPARRLGPMVGPGWLQRNKPGQRPSVIPSTGGGGGASGGHTEQGGVLERALV
jgi:hypothetical protein